MAKKSDVRQAIAALRNKLIDLSNRNRLLNYDVNRQSVVRFVDAPLQQVYERLMDSKTKGNFAVRPLPELNRRDRGNANGDGKITETDWALQNGISTTYECPISESSKKARLQTLLFEADANRRLQRISGTSRLAREESGANVLFLVLGFLEYPDKDDADRVLQAPLVSIPIRLDRVIVHNKLRYSVVYTGEDLEPNAALQERFKAHYNIVLPAFNEDSGDIEGYLSLVNKAVGKTHDVRVVSQVAMGIMPNIASIALSRDLDPEIWSRGSKNLLVDHQIVQQLLSGVRLGAEGGISLSENGRLPFENSENLCLAFDADSSQEEAIKQVVQEGKSLVVSGPPGTGKSQTIANMIGALLHAGKSVLFIADKLAALQVVQARLTDVGLEPFLLELHGTKVNKKDVLESLRQRLEIKTRKLSSYEEELIRRKESGAAIDQYVQALHKRERGSAQSTIYSLVWRNQQYDHDRQQTRGVVNLAKNQLANLPSEHDAVELLRKLQVLYENIRESEFKELVQELEINVSTHDDLELLDRGLQERRTVVANLETSPYYIPQRYLSVLSGHGVLTLRRLQQVISDVARDIGDKRERELVTVMVKNKSVRSQSKEYLEQYIVSMGRLKDLEAQMKLFCRKQSKPVHQHIDAYHTLAMLLEPAKSSSLREIRLLIRRQREAVVMLQQRCQDLKSALSWLLSEYEQLAVDPRKLVTLLYMIRAMPEEVTRVPRSLYSVDDRDQVIHSITEQSNILLGIRNRIPADVTSIEMLNRDVVGAILKGSYDVPWWRSLFGGKRKALKKLLQRELTIAGFKVEDGTDCEQVCRYVERYDVLQSQWESRMQSVGYHKAPDPAAVTTDHYERVFSWYDLMYGRINDAGLDPARLIDKCVVKRSESVANAERLANLLESVLLPALSVAGESQLMMYDGDDYGIGVVCDRASECVRQHEESISTLSQVIDDDQTTDEIHSLCELARQSESVKDELALLTRSLDMCFLGMAVSPFSWSEVEHSVHMCEKLTSSVPIQLIKDVLELCDSSDDLRSIAKYAHQLDERTERLDQLDTSISRFIMPLSHVERLHESHWDQVSSAGKILLEMTEYSNHRRVCIENSLAPFVEYLEMQESEKDDLSVVYKRSVVKSQLRLLFAAQRKALVQLHDMSTYCNAFIKSDVLLTKSGGRMIANRAAFNAAPPPGHPGVRVQEKTEMSLLQYLLPQQRPRVALRRLLAQAGESVMALKPCFMMSPSAVAQYLTPGHLEFDVVIIDEASQVRAETAIGSVARGRQLVVVGDRQQLPPTSFFVKHRAEDEDDDETVAEANSILDLAEAHLENRCSLMWHYRSRHESLIAFSNTSFYNEQLVVFPSPFRRGKNLGIYGVYIQDAEYANSLNPREADECVRIACQLIEEYPSKSLGIVVLNAKQAELIQNLFDRQYANSDALQRYCGAWDEKGYPFFIKNLENVQGDERDMIIVGTTFGPATGDQKVHQNFGPISRIGGERRLNVLFTRARERVTLVTSLLPENVRVGSDTPRGTVVLRDYLEYARRNASDYVYSEDVPSNEDFVAAIMQFLQSRGYRCHPFYGSSSYRIEVAVEHPDKEGELLAAIESDGIDTSIGGTHRDRFRIRPEVLESLGWKNRYIRLWSIDWYRDPVREQEKLLKQLETIRSSTNGRSVDDEQRWVEAATAVNSASANGVKDVQIGDMHPSTEAVESALLIQHDSDVPIVRYGDVVTYINVDTPDEKLTMRIVRERKDDIAQGIFSIDRPIARLLHGTKVGDEVVLRLAASSKAPQTFRVLDILPTPA